MDELTDSQTETSQPSLLNLDWLLISAGVGVLSLLPTFLTLIIAPHKLAPQLGGKPPSGRRLYLGPGQFFVLCVIVFVLIGSVLRPKSNSTEVSPALETTETFNAGKMIGRGIRNFVETTAETLASGDVWSAALIALPIFAFAVALGFIIAILIGTLTQYSGFKKVEDPIVTWDIRHSMGSALYIVGALTLWNALFLAFALNLTSLGLPVLVGGLIFLSLFMTAIVGVGWQTYAFAKGRGIEDGPGLFFTASAVPIAVIGLVIGWIMISAAAAR